MRIERRYEALERSRRDTVIAFGAGVIVTLLFMLVILLLALLWGGFR